MMFEEREREDLDKRWREAEQALWGLADDVELAARFERLLAHPDSRLLAGAGRSDRRVSDLTRYLALLAWDELSDRLCRGGGARDEARGASDEFSRLTAGVVVTGRRRAARGPR